MYDKWLTKTKKLQTWFATSFFFLVGCFCPPYFRCWLMTQVGGNNCFWKNDCGPLKSTILLKGHLRSAGVAGNVGLDSQVNAKRATQLHLGQKGMNKSWNVWIGK